MKFSTAVVEAIVSNNIQFFVNKTKASDARKIISELSGEKIPSKCLLKCKDVSKQTDDCGCFRCLCRKHCKFFLKIRRKPYATRIDLTADQWETLKTFVQRNLGTLSRLSLDQGVEFIKSKISTNHQQVNGLPSRLHVWKK